MTPRGLAATASTRTERSEGEGLPGRPQESIRSERKDTDLGNRSFIQLYPKRFKSTFSVPSAQRRGG